MTEPATPTVEDLRQIAEQVWKAYLDPEGIRPLVPGDVPPATEVSASVSLTGAWHGHVVVACSARAARRAAAAFLRSARRT